jgi:glycosyltransferase involved in cell wall biosynthesis
MPDAPRRLLMVTREFAPTGAVGVERVIKYAKYLPEYGWEPIVLTGSNPSPGFKQDLILAQDVKDVVTLRCFVPDLFRISAGAKALLRRKGGDGPEYSTRLYKPRGPWHPKSLIVPDSQVLWVFPALYTAVRHARKYNCDLVYATLGPSTNALVGYLIAKTLRLPLLLDYRDPWTDAFSSPRRFKFLAALETRLEAGIFSSAGAVTTLDPVCLQTPLRNARRIPPVEVIPNGYDEDDFDCAPMDLPRRSMVHTGNLHAGRSLTDTWAIMREVFQRAPELKGQVHFWQLGTVDEFVIDQLENPPDGLVVHYIPPVPMKEAIRYMLGAELLLVMSPDNNKNAPAKMYQYLRANRSILALAEKGADEFINTAKQANEGFCCHLKEHAAAAEYLVRQLQRSDHPTLPIGPNITRYSRREQTGRLAAMLETALAGARAS